MASYTVVLGGGLMPVAVAMVIIFGVVVFAIALIGLLWAIVFLLPFYVYVGIAVYLIWRSNKRKAQLVREVERQRLFNEQEMRAWNSSLDDDRKELEPIDRDGRAR